MRNIVTVGGTYAEAAMELIQRVFTEHQDETEGRLVRRLAEEIRASDKYVPGLEIAMTDENDAPVGYAMFSRFHLDGRYSDELLILTPVAVKTELQRQHISKELIEYGFSKARELGFTAVIVEGNPRNYNARGFVTAAEHGIMPGKTVRLPKIECLMVKELVPGALGRIKGNVEYTDYKTLTE